MTGGGLDEAAITARHRLAAPSPPTEGHLTFRVVWLRDGSSAHFVEPNRRIWEHLHGTPTTGPATR